MKRMKHLCMILTMALFCLMGMVSCQKDMVGKQIRIKASTRPEGLPTKTAYSGETDSNFERIDWVEGDKILLAMKQNGNNQQQVYSITGVSASGRYSTAGLEPYGSDHGLMWGTGIHDFWAAYPSTATFDGYTIKSAIPSTQTLTYKTTTNHILYYAPDMTKALMVAGLQQDPSDAGINLDFYPAITTFDFTVGANSDIVIKGFEMETTTSGESTYQILTGDATATFNSGSSMSHAFSATGTTGQSITASFSSSAAISTTTSLNFKLFAVPKDIRGVRIIFTLSDDTTRSLNLKQDDAWILFPACKKINITGLLVPGAVWHIYMDDPRVEQWTIHPDIEFGVE